VGESFFPQGNNLYCVQDYQDSFAPRCSACGEVIEGSFKNL